MAIIFDISLSPRFIEFYYNAKNYELKERPAGNYKYGLLEYDTFIFEYHDLNDVY